MKQLWHALPEYHEVNWRNTLSTLSLSLWIRLSQLFGILFGNMEFACHFADLGDDFGKSDYLVVEIEICVCVIYSCE